MSRGVKRRGSGVVILVGLTMVIALGFTRGPEVMAEAAFFHVTEVRLQGERFLTRDQVEELLDLPPAASIWDDPAPLARRVRRHALVEEARIHRRPPGTLVVEVTERTPVALLPTPTLVPVDREGRVLPVDLTRHRLDLPLLEPHREPWDGGGELGPVQIRTLAGEADRLARIDPAFFSTVSELAADSRGNVMVRLEAPRITLHYRPDAPTHRLREGLRAVADAVERHPDRVPTAVDLRYDDQVVVRFATFNGS